METETWAQHTLDDLPLIAMTGGCFFFFYIISILQIETSATNTVLNLAYNWGYFTRVLRLLWNLWVGLNLGDSRPLGRCAKSAREPNSPLTEHKPLPLTPPPGPLSHQESHGKVSAVCIGRNFCWSRAGQSKRNSLWVEKYPQGQDVSQLLRESDSRGMFKCLVFRKISCAFHLSFEDYFCSVKGFLKWQTSVQAHTKKKKTQGYGKKLRFYLFYWMILEYSNKGTVTCLIISLLHVEMMLDNGVHWYECKSWGKGKKH